LFRPYYARIFNVPAANGAACALFFHGNNSSAFHSMHRQT